MGKWFLDTYLCLAGGGKKKFDIHTSEFDPSTTYDFETCYWFKVKGNVHIKVDNPDDWASGISIEFRLIRGKPEKNWRLKCIFVVAGIENLLVTI